MAKPQYIFLDYGAYEMVRSTCGAANAPWPARASERLHDGCRLRQSRHSGGETAARLGASGRESSTEQGEAGGSYEGNNAGSRGIEFVFEELSSEHEKGRDWAKR